ncbi:unnamed protein product [Macrosiphum euphorbiae]|uniref:Uncharacterized protein n=1 Tax=Macrosiphum euphorbiae TaxID=13131 RepID=A0AAV0XQD5_9HEMI|nr:unnamed protein product [Macrosiphum euphorbiae]
MEGEFEENEISKIVYKNSRDQLASYNSVDWSNSEMSFNRPVFERKWVETRKVVLDIPHEIRNVLMCEMVMPGSTPYINNVPEHYRRQFKELINCKIANGMNIADQIRQIRISMDSRKRILPLVIDYGREMNQHLVALQSRNWILIPKTSKVIEYQKINRDFNKNMNLLCYILSYSKSDWSEIVDTIKYENLDFKEYLENNYHIESSQIKLVKTILSMEVSNEISYPNITYLPIEGEVSIVKRSRVNSEVWFYYRMGKETIQFRYKDTVRGHFCHKDSIIMSITCSLVSFIEFKEALSEIMVFLKLHWLDMTETNMKRLIMKTKERVINDFNGLMGLTRGQEDIILNDIEKMNEDPSPIEFDTENNIRVKIEKDYVLRDKTMHRLKISEEGQVLKNMSGKVIYVVEKSQKPKELSFSSKIKSYRLRQCYMRPFRDPKAGVLDK